MAITRDYECRCHLANISSGEMGSLVWLIMTVAWFTLWSFIGLLLLPTISRNASQMVDRELAEHGADPMLIVASTRSQDSLQDGEPKRSPWIETIFHPIPSVEGRFKNTTSSPWAAWQMARTSLFLSWGCVGLLARAVHCNVGRPELWAMLPSD